MRLEDLVEVGGLLEAAGKLEARHLDDLKHEVVLQVVHEVDHLVAQQVAAVHGLVAVELGDEPRGRAVLAPDGGERVLDALEPPEEGGCLAVRAHGRGGEDGVARRAHLVVEAEAVPARAAGQLVEGHVEALEQECMALLAADSLHGRV